MEVHDDIIVALIKAMGMMSANLECAYRDESMAYNDSAFFALVGELPDIPLEAPDADR